MLLVAVVTAIIATPIAPLGSVVDMASQVTDLEKVAAIVGFIVNSFLNKDSCDLEETQ